MKSITNDTERAKAGILPDILVSTYGNKNVPDAARFDKGTRQGAQEAQHGPRRDYGNRG